MLDGLPCDWMVVLRCTAKLLERMKVRPIAEPEPSSNTLGDWYANTLFVGREQLVLFTSSVTLLPVLVTLKERRTLVPRFAMALGEVLAEIGVAGDRIGAEVSSLDGVVFARTKSRQVLGSMNDFALMFSHARRNGRDEGLIRASVVLAQAPCSPIGMASPTARTRQLLV